jgi:cis-3-alkyl-4-acyloxetan-2-one decarboxylase
MTANGTCAQLLTPDQVAPDLFRASQDRAGFEDEYPFESRWYSVDGHTQHYIDEGQGPVLLMVHGNPTWSFAWRRLITELRQNYRVIAIDHLGCGFSAKPQDRDLYVLDRHIERLRSLVQLLNLQEITLFGHDWGGAIGMGCAGREADRFQRFVLMNTGAFRSQAIPLRIAVCRIPVLGRLGVQGLNGFSLAALQMAVERPLTSAARAGLIAPYGNWEERIAVHEFVQDIPLKPAHRSYATLLEVENSLAQFSHHLIMLTWGMKDWCFTPDFYREFEKRFPNARKFPVADAGHYLFEDAHEKILPEIRQFLEQTQSIGIK